MTRLVVEAKGKVSIEQFGYFLRNEAVFRIYSRVPTTESQN